jgi:ABC-type amino acid transport substrate-binding protein
VVAFSSQDRRAVEVFDALLGEMMTDGTLERIAQRWFNGR